MHGEFLRQESNDSDLAECVKRDYRTARLSERQLALCEFAEKLTRTPWEMTREDIERLKSVGLNDRDILDAVEIIGWFNYINRVADALGVDPEPGLPKA